MHTSPPTSQFKRLRSSYLTQLWATRLPFEGWRFVAWCSLRRRRLYSLDFSSPLRSSTAQSPSDDSPVSPLLFGLPGLCSCDSRNPDWWRKKVVYKKSVMWRWAPPHPSLLIQWSSKHFKKCYNKSVTCDVHVAKSSSSPYFGASKHIQPSILSHHLIQWGVLTLTCSCEVCEQRTDKRHSTISSPTSQQNHKTTYHSITNSGLPLKSLPIFFLHFNFLRFLFFHIVLTLLLISDASNQIHFNSSKPKRYQRLNGNMQYAN